MANEFQLCENSDLLAVIAWSNAQGKSKRQHPSLAGRLGQWMNGIFYQRKEKLLNIHPMCFPALCYIWLLVSVNRGPIARPKAKASTTSTAFCSSKSIIYYRLRNSTRISRLGTVWHYSIGDINIYSPHSGTMTGQGVDSANIQLGKPMSFIRIT